jgi:hypothetical protein
MSVYAKLHCAKWLGDTLRDTVTEALEAPERFEIDQTRLAEKDRDKVLENVATLTGACSAILATLQTTDPPAQVRMICRHLRSEVARRRGEAAGDLAVGAFLFLRIICPAVMGYAGAPTSSSAGARALLLVAKVLQSIASEKSLFHEAAMKSVEEFVVESRPKIRAWYERLCAITDEQLAAAPPLSTRDNVEISDLPLLEDLLRTHFKLIAHGLLPTNKVSANAPAAALLFPFWFVCLLGDALTLALSRAGVRGSSLSSVGQCGATTEGLSPPSPLFVSIESEHTSKRESTTSKANGTNSPKKEPVRTRRRRRREPAGAEMVDQHGPFSLS